MNLELDSTFIIAMAVVVVLLMVHNACCICRKQKEQFSQKVQSVSSRNQAQNYASGSVLPANYNANEAARGLFGVKPRTLSTNNPRVKPTIKDDAILAF